MQLKPNPFNHAKNTQHPVQLQALTNVNIPDPAVQYVPEVQGIKPCFSGPPRIRSPWEPADAATTEGWSLNI